MIKRVLYLHFEMSVSCLNSSKEIVDVVIKDTPYKISDFVCHLHRIADSTILSCYQRRVLPLGNKATTVVIINIANVGC